MRSTYKSSYHRNQRVIDNFQIRKEVQEVLEDIVLIKR